MDGRSYDDRRRLWIIPMVSLPNQNTKRKLHIPLILLACRTVGSIKAYHPQPSSSLHDSQFKTLVSLFLHLSLCLNVSSVPSQCHHPYHPQKQQAALQKSNTHKAGCLTCLACPACHGPCSLSSAPSGLGDHFPLSVTDRSGAHPGTEKEQRGRRQHSFRAWSSPNFRGPCGGDDWIGCPGAALRGGCAFVDPGPRFQRCGEVVGHGISLGRCCWVGG
jgi:hypothetical protein